MNAPIVEGTVARMPPPLDDHNRILWTAGSEGRLVLHRCEACDRWQIPSGPTCASCGGALVEAEASGRGTVFTFTVNTQSWNPEVPTPYVIALVRLDEQDDLLLPTNLVDVAPDAVEIGMAVEVCFEHNGDIWVPLFAPAVA